MRKILFRGKRLPDGEWLYGNHIEKLDPHCENPTYWASLIHDGVLTAQVVGETSVGQFTGMLDRDGVKIFEGDIVENADLDLRVIVYAQNAFEMRLKNGDRESNGIVWYTSVRVVGNIHDNLDLLS